MGFNLRDLRSKLPPGVRVNFVSSNGIDAGSMALKTLLTIGRSSSGQESSKGRSKNVEYLYHS